MDQAVQEEDSPRVESTSIPLQASRIDELPQHDRTDVFGPAVGELEDAETHTQRERLEAFAREAREHVSRRDRDRLTGYVEPEEMDAWQKRRRFS